jgi:four helix bundle protein
VTAGRRGRRETGGGRRETGDGRRETGDGRRETGDGRRETGDGRREAGDGRRETGDGHGFPVSYSMNKRYKFQNLETYKLALEYLDKSYELTADFPQQERFNLKSQLERAATSVVLNIAEGSTGQTDAEQHRFLGLALRSYLETVACLDIAERRSLSASRKIDELRELGHQLFVKLQTMRRFLKDSATRS